MPRASLSSPWTSGSACLRTICAELDNVEVASFDGLLIEYVKARGARVIVRGLRAATDFEYELQIAHANADLRPEVDTVFLPTRTNYGFISASLVREIASHGGDVSRYAPPPCARRCARKFGTRDSAQATLHRSSPSGASEDWSGYRSAATAPIFVPMAREVTGAPLGVLG